MKIAKRRLKLNSKDGYMLAWVLICTVIVLTISAVALSAAVVSNNSTLQNHESQQAYFTAKSAASAVADYIKENCDTEDKILTLVNQTGTGSYVGMGSYTVSVSYVTADKLCITAKGTYNGNSDTVKLYLIKQTTAPTVVPTNHIIYFNGGTGTGLGQCNLIGDVFADGDFNLGSGSQVTGYLIANGTTSLDGSGTIAKNVYSLGDVTFGGSGTVSNNLYTKGSLTLTGSGTVGSDAIIDGNLSMPNGYIKGNATVGGNVSFGGGAKIYGKLSYFGSVSCAYGNISSFVNGGSEKLTSYTPLDDSIFTPATLPVITAPAMPGGEDINKPVTITNNTISTSGLIDSSVMTILSGLPYKSTITIDTSVKDIYLKLNTAYNFTNGLSVMATGPHNVYLFMTGNSSITLNSNEYFGSSDINATPNIFIIGDGAQSISLVKNSEMHAVVYIPQGSLEASGAALEECKFKGSCTVKSANITSNVTFKYACPSIDGTPLDVFDGSGGSGSAYWKTEGWDK